MVSEWTDSVLVPANYVTTQRILGATFIFINLFVIIKEMMKRVRDKPKFKSKSWKWLSMLSIIGGLVHSLSWIMHYSDSICIVLYPLTDYVGKALPICVGLYQLSRLYQCFADGTVPGGYPIWLFYVMSVFGILNVLAFIPVIVWNERFMDCGWTDNHQFHMEFAAWSQEEWAIWDTIALALYLIWDITTLLLLVIKLRSLTASMSVHSERLVLGIRRNVMRIVILTIFYMLMTAAYTVSNFWGYYYKEATIWDWCVSAGLWLLSSTTMSYAVFLMEPHNSREYGLFLKRIIGLKLHFCCCCYRGDVVKQRDHFLPKNGLEVSLIATKTEMITNFTITGTAFNDFSLNKSPSTKYQAPYVSPIVTPNKRVEVVTEGDAVNIPLLRIPENLSRNDFLFESAAQNKEEFSSGFSFGVYLEYWRRKRRNSVLPKYFSLREELTMNRHAAITNEQYDVLLRQCRELRAKHCFIAKDIGVMNKICGIEPHSEMTLEHIIAIKVYTDFTAHQAIFKQHCRRLYREETIESVIKRNREIAHWSRLLRECIMFYGETMETSDVVYCGLNARLIFRSLHQRFECPLSTTMQPTVAMQFAEKGNGIVLTLKRSNAKTRYFDVTPFTSYKHEDERLFSGSTLKIIDISLGLKSLKRYINMLRMLEQIANGHFVDFGEQTAELLVSFLRRVVAQSVMDVLREHMMSNGMSAYLDEESYDTDAVLLDIENIEESNFIHVLNDAGNNVLKVIQETRDGLLDVDTIPKYIWCLFTNFLDEMRVMKGRGALWMNHNELGRENFNEITALLFGNGKVFDALSIDKETIPAVKQFEWTISGDVYEELMALSVSKYIISPQFTYDLATGPDSHRIIFHFRFYRQHSVENPQCAIFLEIDEMPNELKRLRVEVDMKCDKKKRFRQLLRTHVMTKEQRIIGFNTFDHREVERNNKMEWFFAVKILNAETDKLQPLEDGEEYLKDLYHIFE